MTFNTIRTQNVTCPYCGYEDKDSWEIDFGPGLDGDRNIVCVHCQNEFFTSRIVDAKYTSQKLKK